MGRASAEGMAGAIADGMIDLETALNYHLGTNHYPPVSSKMIPVCKQAIEVANADGPWDAHLKLPNGTTAPVGAIIEALHLHAFIEDPI